MAAANVTLHVAEIEIHNQTVSIQPMDGPEIPIIRYTVIPPPLTLHQLDCPIVPYSPLLSPFTNWMVQKLLSLGTFSPSLPSPIGWSRSCYL
jgi:hypothetical protein